MSIKVTGFEGVGPSLIAMTLLAGLGACGGGGGDAPPPQAPPPGQQPPPPPSPPPTDPVSEQVARAREEILADTCFLHEGGNCAWTDRPYRPTEFNIPGTGEAILIVDEFSRLSVNAIRFRKRIKHHYRLDEGGRLSQPDFTWHIPAALWNALDRFSGPDHIASQRLADVAAAVDVSYTKVQFDHTGHGSYVFSLIVDTNPQQPLVLLDSIDLAEMAHVAYCDANHSPASDEALWRAADAGASELGRLIREDNVRFINYSGGHTLATIRDTWTKVCETGVPSDTVLRKKLAAYAPIYKALFATPGVLAAHAAIDFGNVLDNPYDQLSPAYPNRLRVGYFTTLDSGLDPFGAGQGSYDGWPSIGRADLYLNTGVLPARPFPYNRTPLLQIDQFGLGLYPITTPHTSWVTPLALARFIHIGQSQFAGRAMDNSLIAAIFDAAIPPRCPSSPGERCRYQDPLLHGQIEATRLGYRPLTYP